MKKYSIFVLLTILLIACSSEKTPSTEKADDTPRGINLELMDTTVRPQDDFLNFVNGKWIEKTKIPDDRSRWGSFDALGKNTLLSTLSILKNAAKSDKYKEGTDQKKAIDYFSSIMDFQNRDKKGISPLSPYLVKINNIKTKEGIIDFMAETEPFLSSSFFAVGVDSDMKDSDKNTLTIYTSGLGLPERDYYVSDEADAVKIRDQYKNHLVKMFHFLSEDEDAISNSQKNVMTIETALAKAKLTKEDSRKPEKTYNPMKLEDLKKLMPHIDIEKYLTTLKLNVPELVVSQPEYLKAVDNIINTSSLESLKDYITWTVFRGAASELSVDISNTNWTFYGRTLSGQIKRRPLEERALSTVNWSIGEAVGKLYVEKMFPPEAKVKAREMIKNLQKAYVQRINASTWMSAPTKVKAIEKVNKLQIKIGYPDKWKDYSALKITSPANGGTYFENSNNVSKWNFNEQVEKLNKPVDKTEWGMAPQIVNAYYNPSYNEIVFPAAILQPPFYDYKADAAVNYGGMGAVIGHEISHGFDDQGAKFNAEGNFESWWTDEDFEKFNTLVKKLADQYSKVEVIKDVFVNGEFTSGENIGDLGGINAAYTALQLYYKDHQKPKEIQGFTPEQRFFMSWATIWRTKARDKAIKQQVKTNPHSPGAVRAVQPLENVDAFYEAFDIKKGDKLYIAPEDRVKIW